MEKLTKQSGYITLLTVITVGMIGMAASVSVLLLGTSSTKSIIGLEQSYKAKGLANACAELASQNITDNVQYTGSGSATINQANCNFVVINPSQTTKTINATGTYNNTVRKIKVTITMTATPSAITNAIWQDVNDF